MLVCYKLFPLNTDSSRQTWAGANDRLGRSVVKHHSFDIQWAKNRFFVDKIAVFGVTVASGQYDTHVAHVDTARAQVSSI